MRIDEILERSGAEIPDYVFEDEAVKGEQPVWELTPEEEQLLTSFYTDDDRIRAGKLYKHQIDALEALRYAHSYLEQKYPGYEFSFSSYIPANKHYGDGRIIFHIADDDSKYYELFVSDIDGGYEGRDTFYKALVREEYDREIQRIIKDKLNAECLSYTDFYKAKGIDTDGNNTVEELIAMKADLPRRTDIFFNSEDIDEADIDVSLKKIFDEAGIYGSYGVYYAKALLDSKEDAQEVMAGMRASVYENPGRKFFNCFEV